MLFIGSIIENAAIIKMKSIYFGESQGSPFLLNIINRGAGRIGISVPETCPNGDIDKAI